MLVEKVTTLLRHFLNFQQLKQLHTLILVHDLNHLNGLLIHQLITSQSTYSQNISHYLRSILLHLKQPDAGSATSVIRYFCTHTRFQEAFALYVELHTSGFVPSTFSVASALKACARTGNKNGGTMIHGDLAKAEELFSSMTNKDVVSWNSMVSGYSRNGDMDKALSLFQEMPERKLSSWNAMISGYVECGKVGLARNFYNSMPERNSISCITMIGGYSKCGDVESARELFSKMDRKDHLLYNAMITCYAKNSRPKEALHLFSEMIEPNVKVQPDKMTLATVTSACSQLGELSFGSWIHDCYMKQLGIAMDDHLCTALVYLYAKCGSIDTAFNLFHKLNKKDVVAYTSMILGCGLNGKEQIAIKLFDEMMESNIRPNLLTFTGVLTALSHVGMVEESYHCFNSMKKYGLVPTPDHYSLMVEILGRAGRLEEAHDLIKGMPMKPHAGVWGALLLACSTHNNVELGETAAKHCFELEADNSGYGSLLANIYAGAGRWEDAKRLRNSIHEKGLVKIPGSSWMDHMQA
ncbi:tetratricopeptide repeat (TPR)-like superfamily protein [Artemisia annua]|uniref:Tetratricopeptide repeat (TPR)-like superfamily protein n=1 Tax=Artemisia annua TaxID=35608 RepID=A0A2U1PCL0_ARTAN|nr:tetratricopeptide repeat (TPR)-like superfamily protein [Artemisia annua]